MKIHAFLFIATLLLFTAFIQDTEEALSSFPPPGRRELQRKVLYLLDKKKGLSLWMNYKSEAKSIVDYQPRWKRLSASSWGAAGVSLTIEF